MPKRVPVNTIVVKRDGKNFVPPIGQPFDFTQAEIDDIRKLMPGAVRKIINEAPDEPKVEPAKASQDSKPNARGRGRIGSQADSGGDDAAKTTDSTKAAESTASADGGDL